MRNIDDLSAYLQPLRSRQSAVIVAENSAEPQQLILTSNQDGSIIWFDPIAPEGHESKWIQTLPGKSYNVRLRFYIPLEPWFDKTWRPDDFEIVE